MFARGSSMPLIFFPNTAHGSINTTDNPSNRGRGWVVHPNHSLIYIHTYIRTYIYICIYLYASPLVCSVHMYCVYVVASICVCLCLFISALNQNGWTDWRWWGWWWIYLFFLLFIFCISLPLYHRKQQIRYIERYVHLHTEPIEGAHKCEQCLYAPACLRLAVRLCICELYACIPGLLATCLRI